MSHQALASPVFVHPHLRRGSRTQGAGSLGATAAGQRLQHLEQLQKLQQQKRLQQLQEQQRLSKYSFTPASHIGQLLLDQALTVSRLQDLLPVERTPVSSSLPGVVRTWGEYDKEALVQV